MCLEFRWLRTGICRERSWGHCESVDTMEQPKTSVFPTQAGIDIQISSKFPRKIFYFTPHDQSVSFRVASHSIFFLLQSHSRGVL